MRLSLLLGAIAALSAVSIAQDNVLILLADDIGVDYIGCYGEGPEPANTPNLDALASRGVLFRDVWAAPICSATRAQIMTGRHGLRHGIGHVVTKDHALALKEITLPEILQANPGLGIVQAAFGKWHLGNQDVGGDLAPNFAGWTHFAGTMANLNQPENYYTWDHVQNGSVSQSNDYSTTRIVDDFLEWHGAVQDPWFALVAFHAAHEPLHAPPAHLHTVTFPLGDPRDHPYPYFRATVEALDTEIGRLLAGLGDELDSTHVIFLSDNGTIKLASQPPFEPSHAKLTPYEGGLNVPMIVAGPAVVAGGRESKALVTTTDVFDTALELAGLALDGDIGGALTRDAVSFLPCLVDPSQNASMREFAYQEYFFPSGAGPYKKDWRIARDKRYKLIRNRTQGTDELYDLRLDPFETINLLNAPLTLSVDLRYKALSAHIEEMLASK